MLKRVVIGAGLAVIGAVFAVLPALAYTGTPGTSASTGSPTVAAGGTTTFTVFFPGGPGQTITFSASGGGANCIVTFSPPTATTDASGNATTTVSFSSGCSGTVTLTATSGAQNVSSTVFVSGLPPASTQEPVGTPLPWMALLIIGLGLVAASIFGVNRKSATA